MQSFDDLVDEFEILTIEDNSVEEIRELSFETTITYANTNVPSTLTWQIEPIYGNSATGAKMIWQVGWDGSKLHILHGHNNGKLQHKTRDVKTNMSGRNLQQQALLEARDRYKGMYYKNYRPLIDDGSFSITYKPMLAQLYKGGIKERCAAEVKMDGVRSLANIGIDGEVKLRSREGREQPYFYDHKKELKTFFMYLPRGSHLDAELYSHDMSFNTLIGVVKTVKFVHPRQNEVKYCIFDIIIPELLETIDYESRRAVLYNAYNAYINDGNTCQHFTILPHTIVSTEEEIEFLHKHYLQAGYEGLMLKKLFNPSNSKSLKYSLYRQTRCVNVLKVKKFTDEEGTVMSVVEGEGTEKGLAIFNIKDVRGNIFPCRPRGSFEQRAIWYNKSDECIGKPYTFRYFELTEDSVPRFPVGIAFRDYE
ncbi:DNA ligase [compost metagenome]